MSEDRCQRTNDKASFFFSPACLRDCLRPISFILSPLSFNLASSTLSLKPAEILTSHLAPRNPYLYHPFSSISTYTRLAIAKAALAAGMPA